MTIIRLRVAILISAILLFGFAISAVARDDIRIVSLSPPTNKSLQTGASVPFEINVEYNIHSADYRQVRIEILRGGDGEPVEVLSRWTQVFPKGRDVLAIKRVVSIPETGRITVGVFVQSPGRLASGDKPTATEKKEYDVVDEAGRRIKPREGGNTLKITSVSPSPGSVLRVGENVDFDARIDYELRSGNSGRIVWFLENSGEVQTFLSSQVVSKGKGTLRLNKSVQIHPGLGTEPRMFVFLMAEGYIRSLGADFGNYRLATSQQTPQDSTPQITVNAASEQVDRIRIVSISPSPDQSLRIGQTIDFEVAVEYELTSSDTAELLISFSGRPTVALDGRVVSKGQGFVTVTRRMLIPPTAVFDVTAGLSPPSTAYDKRNYTLSPQQTKP